MNLLNASWHRLKRGLLIAAVALAAVVVWAPKPAMAEESNEPYVLTPEGHWFWGDWHDPQPWPNEDGSPVEFPIVVEDDRINVEFNMEAKDVDAPRGYVLWQLFDESGKEIFSAYLIGLSGYCTNYFGYVLNEGTYIQRLTQYGCEGTECKVALEANTDPDTWVFPGFGDAQHITVGSTVSGTLADSHETAYGENETATHFYKDLEFSLGEPTALKFSAQAEYGPTQLALMDSNGTILKGASSTYDPEQDIYAGFDLDCGTLGVGTYYLRYQTVSLPSSSFDASGQEFSVSVKAGRDVYRLYDPETGEHLFTTSAVERDACVASGWNDEGVAWRAPLSSSHPVYRLYDPGTGDHLYTSSLNEYNVLGQRGWNQENVAFYSVDDPAVGGYEGMAVSRFYDPTNMGAGSHHYVCEEAGGGSESANLIASGWSSEGTGWTALSW